MLESNKEDEKGNLQPQTLRLFMRGPVAAGGVLLFELALLDEELLLLLELLELELRGQPLDFGYRLVPLLWRGWRVRESQCYSRTVSGCL